MKDWWAVWGVAKAGTYLGSLASSPASSPTGGNCNLIGYVASQKPDSEI